ncbi:MAG: hypothetical protein V3S71_02730 [Acidobacteriota bacterium]
MTIDEITADIAATETELEIYAAAGDTKSIADLEGELALLKASAGFETGALTMEEANDAVAAYVDGNEGTHS